MIEIEMSQIEQHGPPGQRYWDAMVKKARGLFTASESLSAPAFQQLLEPLKDHLYNFIYKSLGFSEDADDVYQEAVLRAFKYRSSYKPGNAFKTWLFTIANNEIKAWFNRHKKSAGTGTLEEHVHIPEDIDPGKEAMIRDIYDVARQLGEKQRNVFFLFYDHGFSIRDIHDITGLREGNIKFILNRCRETIKEKLNLSDGKEER